LRYSWPSVPYPNDTKVATFNESYAEKRRRIPAADAKRHLVRITPKRPRPVASEVYERKLSAPYLDTRISVGDDYEVSRQWALTGVVATCYLLGVSTHRMDKLVQSPGITSLSKSQDSDMARELGAHVEQFRTRLLADAGPFTFVAADTLVIKVREGDRSCPCTRWSPPAWTPTATGRCWACSSSAARTAPADCRSSATSSPEA
jgi:hypothetical protein